LLDKMDNGGDTGVNNDPVGHDAEEKRVWKCAVCCDAMKRLTCVTETKAR
jgi:hypothetical protein